MDEITIYPAAEMLLSDEVLKKGIKKIQKDRDAAVQKFRDAFLTEEAGRLKQVVTETLENLTEFHDFSAAEHFLRYFYKDVVTFTDYFDTENTLILLDETNRLLEQAQAVETEFRESMEHRLEKGYLLAGQTDLLISTRQIQQKINRKNCVSL